MLYIVATPIGNLRDVTLRALDVLREADVIACEDTRRTQKLLMGHGVRRPDGSAPKLVSFHEYSGPGRTGEILSWLEQGRTVALVSDGGTPLISDPGFPLLREAIGRGIDVRTLPGPSALTAALSAAGLPTEHVSFRGFLPPKSAARRRELEALRDREDTLVFYESPYRLVKTLRDMADIFGDRQAVVARELTKKFEEFSRGHLATLTEKFSRGTVLGELVILVAGKDQKEIFS